MNQNRPQKLTQMIHMSLLFDFDNNLGDEFWILIFYGATQIWLNSDDLWNFT